MVVGPTDVSKFLESIANPKAAFVGLVVSGGFVCLVKWHVLLIDSRLLLLVWLLILGSAASLALWVAQHATLPIKERMQRRKSERDRIRRLQTADLSEREVLSLFCRGGVQDLELNRHNSAVRKLAGSGHPVGKN